MRTELFDYALPAELIARRPPPERDAARLLVIQRHAFEHRRIHDLSELIPAGALVVINDTRVIRARLIGMRRGSGGKVELMLLRRRSELGVCERWEAIGRANKPLRPGTAIDVGQLSIEVLTKNEQGTLEVSVHGEPTVEVALEREGRVPIPPYLDREDDAEDAVRYQTVYARKSGSVAAPTAGLHFSERLMDELSARGAEFGKLTLHVGVGTFRPVKSLDLDDHVMHTESFEVTDELVSQIARARARGAKIVAVGTTVVRALESAYAADGPGPIRPMRDETRLFIRPGHAFKVIDALLTNFHLPKSTLLALVSAFAGRERVLEAYSVAITEGYRFLSYGDAMWIPDRLGEIP